MTGGDQGPLAGLGATQAAIVRYIRKMGAVPRADIAQAFGITPAAVSMVTRDLIARGIVAEGRRHKTGRGAPHVDLTLAPGLGFALGVHASRHSVVMMLLDYAGAVVGERHLPGAYERFTDLRDTIVAGARDLLGSASGALVGAGVALPTRFDRAGQQLDLADEVLSWAEADMSVALGQALGCPVVFENDANAAAFGEMTLGNSAGHRDFAYIYLSEGVGSGVVIDGRLYRGAGGNAGEIGGLRPRTQSRPSFDDLAHWCAARGANVPVGRDPQQWGVYLAQNPAVLDEWLQRAGPELASLGYAVAAILAPEAIYLGGVMPAVVRERLLKWLDFSVSMPALARRVAQPQVLLPEVVATDAVAFGAAAMVLSG